MKKGQSALEFLTTYGWAFLVILIMIGALAYFGVLDPNRFLPKKCLLGAPLGTCADSVIDSTGDIKISLVNGDTKSWNNANITFAGTLGSTPCVKADLVTAAGVWEPGASKQFTLDTSACGITSGQTLRGGLSVNYTASGDSYIKTISGEFSARCCGQ